MDRERLKGKLQEIKGKFKKESGNVRHDRSTQAEGFLGEKAGKARQGIGEARDEAKREPPPSR